MPGAYTVAGVDDLPAGPVEVWINRAGFRTITADIVIEVLDSYGAEPDGPARFAIHPAIKLVDNDVIYFACEPDDDESEDFTLTHYVTGTRIYSGTRAACLAYARTLIACAPSLILLAREDVNYSESGIRIASDSLAARVKGEIERATR